MTKLSDSYALKSTPREQPQTLSFHTLFDKEFTGTTAEEIVQALYHNSKKGMGNMSFDEWWNYQSYTWQDRYGQTIGEPNQPGACAKLLEFMVKIGALESGPLPSKNTMTAQQRVPHVR